MGRKGIWKALPILLFLTVISAGAILGCWWYQNKNKVIISHESGIYTDSFSLEINILRPGTIYYTIDGTAPVPENDSVLIYEKPIEIGMGPDTEIYSLQFKCVYSDGDESPVFTREFIMEEKGTSRYQTNYIVSVTGDEEALWGYEYGIFARGRQFDEYMAANPDADLINVIVPANYYNDNEVPVHVSLFTADGKEIISKNCGIKIYGNVTRAKNQKSFRLYARDIYDGVNEFTYTLLPELVSEKTNTVIDEYQRLSFHNSGNDNGYAFVRNALIGKLASQFGFGDVLVSESAVVYINGKYQGFYWLQNTYDDKYFKEKYGDYSGEMVVLEGQLDEMTNGKDETLTDNIHIDEYNEFCEWAIAADMNDNDNWQRVCETIDVNNFAKYMAIEYYVGNTDWPHNNVKVYKYVPDRDLNTVVDYEDNPVFDGRYRFLLYDTDYGMGLLFKGWFGYDVRYERLKSLCDVNGTSGLFGSMMRREEFKNLFVNAVLLLTQGVFSAENVETVLTEFIGQEEAELHYMFEETDLLKNSLWESDDNSYTNVEIEQAEILSYAHYRPAVLRDEMVAVLGCGAELELYMELAGEGTLLLDGLQVGNTYKGYCFEKVPMHISCELPAGSRVVGYYVNDHYIEGSVLELNISHWVGVTNRLSIWPDVETEPVEKLSIVSYDTDGRDDYIILENTGNTELLLFNYSISDSEETSKGRLPSEILQPGEKYYVYGKQYQGDIADNGIRMSFSWNDEEKIILSNSEKGIVEER